MRPSGPSAYQAAFEYVMFRGNYTTEYDRLKALAAAYAESKIDKRWFVHGIFWMFADDGGMDWCDESKSLDRLAKAILGDT